MAAAVSLQKDQAQLAVVQQQATVAQLEQRISVLSSNVERLRQERAAGLTVSAVAEVAWKAAGQRRSAFIKLHSEEKKDGQSCLKKLKKEEQDELDYLVDECRKTKRVHSTALDINSKTISELTDAEKAYVAENPTTTSMLISERAKLDVLKQQLALFK